MNLSKIALALIGHLGAFGVGVAVFLNGLGVPGISEVLLPLAGVGVRTGKLNAVTVIVVALICQVIGVSIAYAIARYGGVALIERYGKYFMISHRELKKAHKLFERYGSWIVLVGAFIPGPQGFIGYAAGLGEMSFGHFLVAALIGKLIWVSGMIYLGYVLGGHLALLDSLVNHIGLLVLVLLILAAIWYIRRQHVQSDKVTTLSKEN